MGKIAVAVYAKISGNAEREVTAAFQRAVLLESSNYFENGVYGVVLDPPDSPCYISCRDGEIVLLAKRCLGALPNECRDKFFVTVRARRYNVNRGKGEAFSCEGGALGALRDLTNGGGGEFFRSGEAIDGAEFIYFSASGGIIEAGGINGLLKLALSESKSVLPLIKVRKGEHRHKGSDEGSVHITKRKKQGSFSLSEGLYIRGATVDPKNATVCEKICVFEEVHAYAPHCTETMSKVFDDVSITSLRCRSSIGAVIKKKKNYPRADYRAALSASRLFNIITENGCPTVIGVTEAIYSLTALTAMRTLGFIGEKELLKRSDELFCIAEEAICVKIPTESLGKAVFLLTVLLGAYRAFAQTEPLFLSLGLRAGELKRFLLRGNRSLIGENNDVYLIMCCKEAVPDVFFEYTLPRLMRAALSDDAYGEYRKIGGSAIENEAALCVLMSASNACCELNIREFILSDPVFGAKLSFLSRIKDKSGAEGVPEPVLKRTDRMLDPSRMLGYNWLDPVKKRFFMNGVGFKLLPYAAYIDGLARRFSANNDKCSVKICYITPNSSLVTHSLLKAAELFDEVSVCMIFESRHALELARRGYHGHAELIFGSGSEIYKAVCADAAFVRRLTPFTTLSELQAETEGGTEQA